MHNALRSPLFGSAGLLYQYRPVLVTLEKYARLLPLPVYIVTGK